MPAKIEISTKTIIFTVFFLILLRFLVEIRSILFIIFISFILMSAFKPLVEKLEKLRLPRVIAILLVYLAGLSVIVYTGSTLIPPLVTQSINLGQHLPKLIKDYLPFISIDVQSLTQQIAPIGENILKVSVGIFSNIFNIFSLFVVSFYMLMEREHFESHLSKFMGKEATVDFITILDRVEERLGAWVRGQFTLALIIGLSTYLGLLLLDLPYILPLSILAGIMEIIPIIGPIISAIPAVLVALTANPLLALATIVVFIVIQQLENHLVVPYVVRKSVGLPPVVTIIALMIGARIAGISGAILSVPLIVVAETLVSEYLKLKSPK